MEEGLSSEITESVEAIPENPIFPNERIISNNSDRNNIQLSDDETQTEEVSLMDNRSKKRRRPDNEHNLSQIEDNDDISEDNNNADILKDDVFNEKYEDEEFSDEKYEDELEEDMIEEILSEKNIFFKELPGICGKFIFKI